MLRLRLVLYHGVCFSYPLSKLVADVVVALAVVAAVVVFSLAAPP